MAVLPYRWQHDRPAHVVPRPRILGPIEAALRQGLAVKLIGGRGMGKSVLLWQIQRCFADEPETRVVLIPGPPTESTVAGCLRDLADRLVLDLPKLTPDALMAAAERELGIRRLIVLVDEVDQYVLTDGTGALARSWFNRLESLRKSWIDRFAVVIAGGLGLLHVAHVLGSGLLSRAETSLAAPFDRAELETLAAPLRARTPLDEEVLDTLATLSGGIPALATYGLECLWTNTDEPIQVLRDSFSAFPVRHADFLRAIQDGVSHRGLVGAPGRVLQVIRESPGSVAQSRLRDACVGDAPPVDIPQAVQLLQAAGLVRLRDVIHSDPLDIHPIASIVHLPTVPATGADPLERFALDVARVLAHMGAALLGRRGEKVMERLVG
jgi:energy-coupling factor transporter ATP-binding protein EcfA2